MNIRGVLDDSGWMVCKILAGSDAISQQYYMAGGTALALQLGHRKSYDLDFFQTKTDERIHYEKIYRELVGLFSQKYVRVELKQVDQATVSIHGVKVTFLAYPFPLVEPLVSGHTIAPELAGIKLASPREIALMKAYTIGRRPSYRDYIDLYFLLKSGKATIEYILEKAPGKFVIENETVFSKKLFLEQLGYTGDISDKEAALTTVLGAKLTSQELERYLGQQIREAMRVLLRTRKRGMRL
ncbi:hypothetical protein GFC01_14735 [Desulfofundulus thermobenzoicus]|uniref:Nucleotidyl transferase AbiEii/AbiGii toxin family protein n=1 Tax=Desulfofundulus thermobenzoicus TaxID=29376 RepID=A0A6N7ITV8_9FIRM|nr:nucleotidyl transferase AbiEii/AbiGii toxin family protein [Desulfofundulus thermobenzoicus]MQL53492.1 hypothetical protein [Desulfofundulus thermobenzoicus]